MSKITPEQIDKAMFSSKEGYVSCVVDSIEFDLDRNLTEEEQHSVEQFVDGAITTNAKLKDAIEVARAALDYIDALPKDVVASLPTMPGFDRDWAENALAAGVPADVLEQAAPVDKRFVVDMSGVKRPALSNITACYVCDSESLTWDSAVIIHNDVQQGRLTTRDVSAIFFLGCDECSETLARVSAEDVVEFLNIRQKEECNG